jgi:hypothetical protein
LKNKRSIWKLVGIVKIQLKVEEIETENSKNSNPFLTNVI